jgi:hypothetical protein
VLFAPRLAPGAGRPGGPFSDTSSEALRDGLVRHGRIQGEIALVRLCLSLFFETLPRTKPHHLKAWARTSNPKPGKNNPLAKISRAHRSVGQAPPGPAPAPPPPCLDGTGRDKKFSLWCVVVPLRRKRAGFQTLTIGNDNAGKLPTSHNRERYLSGFNSRRLHQTEATVFGGRKIFSGVDPVPASRLRRDDN